MTEPPTPTEVMLEATRAALRTGRVAPALVTRIQLDALTAAGFYVNPWIEDGGASLLLATAKSAFWSGRFRPAEVIAQQLEELASTGHYLEWRDPNDVIACDEFMWGPNSFDSCEECGLSFWRHGETDPGENRTQFSSES